MEKIEEKKSDEMQPEQLGLDLDPELSVKLTDFEGPLDLLLHLVKENKIEIEDIFLSEVTEQFMAFMNELDTLDVDKAGEYMAMVATLMEIKSRKLLPVMPELDKGEEAPEKILIRQLQEYNMLKEASGKLKEIESVDRLYKDPSEALKEVRYVAKDMSLENLLDAFAHMLNKIEVKKLDRLQPKQIKKDSFSVAEKMNFITSILLENGRILFSELFDERITLNEVVVTFSAMLELIKLQKLKVTQADAFEDIEIVKTDELNGEGNYDNDEID